MGDCSDPSTFKVAIIDSGHMVNHPDSPCITDANGKTNCVENSFVADPWDAPYEAYHGTHVMGIIGSLGGSGPYTNVGVRPTHNDLIRDSPRLCRGRRRSGLVKYLCCRRQSRARRWGEGHQHVTRRRLCKRGSSCFTRDYEKGTLTVAASGNDGQFVDRFPASYNDVILVGAINNDKYWPSFSNCNNNLDVCAPGYYIWSTITKVGAYGTKYGQHDYAIGTSMVAPNVTGVIAKVWSQCSAFSHVEVESCLKTTADFDGLDGNSPQYYSSGLDQAEDAYSCLIKTCC